MGPLMWPVDGKLGTAVSRFQSSCVSLQRLLIPTLAQCLVTVLPSRLAQNSGQEKGDGAPSHSFIQVLVSSTEALEGPGQQSCQHTGGKQVPLLSGSPRR